MGATFNALSNLVALAAGFETILKSRRLVAVSRRFMMLIVDPALQHYCLQLSQLASLVAERESSGDILKCSTVSAEFGLPNISAAFNTTPSELMLTAIQINDKSLPQRHLQIQIQKVLSLNVLPYHLLLWNCGFAASE